MPDNPRMTTVLALVESGDSKVIQLMFGSRKVEPGQHIPKEEAREIPSIGWNNARAPTGAPKKFLVISLDVDAPFPSFAPLSPALHWLQAGLTIDTSSAGVLTSSDPVIAFWAPPGPPPISAPHRYLFLLYEQPADFDTQQYTKPSGYGIMDRMRWDLSKFEKQAKLGPAVAATYFFSK